MLKKILENGKYFAIIVSSTLFVSAVALALYSIYLIVNVFIYVAQNISQLEPTYAVTQFIALMDVNLIAIVLYLFSVGIYELFLGELKIPAWLKVKTIEELKSKLASIIVLILVITFAKNLVEWKEPLHTLYFAISVSLVSGVLIFYSKAKDDFKK